MKPTAALAALIGWVSMADAHYTFDRIFVNGQAKGNPWQYIMENTRREKYMPTKFINSFGTTPLDNDFRCNQGAFSNQGKTQVIEIAAGSEVAFQLAYGARMEHPGPTQVYMSKAPGSVKNYDGSGDWFKIHQEGLCRNVPNHLINTNWCTWGKDRISFRIPQGTPNGEYLLRPEHIGLHGAHGGEAEFYYACALVRITGGASSGNPGPTVKIPGVYGRNDPAVNFSLWNAGTSYPHIPGPAVWNGASSGGGGGGGSQPPPNNGGGGGGGGGAVAPVWGQCGGSGYSGPTQCASGSRCVVTNDYYSQCQP